MPPRRRAAVPATAAGALRRTREGEGDAPCEQLVRGVGGVRVAEPMLQRQLERWRRLDGPRGVTNCGGGGGAGEACRAEASVCAQHAADGVRRGVHLEESDAVSAPART